MKKTKNNYCPRVAEQILVAFTKGKRMPPLRKLKDHFLFVRKKANIYECLLNGETVTYEQIENDAFKLEMMMVNKKYDQNGERISNLSPDPPIPRLYTFPKKDSRQM